MHIYNNQKKAGNKIADKLIRSGDNPVHILLSAQFQSGKTGALMHTCKKLYDHYFEGKSKKPNLLFLGPSDTVLKSQTFDRINSEPKIVTCLVGGDIWHAPDTWSTQKGAKLKNHVQAILATKEPLIIICDEAHIGIGTSKHGLQKVPEFFEEIVGSLPGVTGRPNIKYIQVTATPYSHDTYVDYMARIGQQCLIEEVYLEPGTGYTSFGDFVADERIYPNFSRRLPADLRGRKEKQAWKKQNDEEFRPRFTELLKLFKEEHKNDPKYFVVRVTSKADRDSYFECFKDADMEYSLYESKKSNIKEFEQHLDTTPNECKALVIIQSYKQGKTLNLDHVGAWYENDTSNGRHDADVGQSVGRCCGYTAASHNFPIYCDEDVIHEIVKYFDKCQMSDFQGKRDMALSNTHTKRETQSVPTRAVFKGVNYEVVERFLMEELGATSDQIVHSKCSKNRGADVAYEITAKAPRQSQTRDGTRRYNVRHMDAPSANKAFYASWVRALAYHDRYVVVYETGHTTITTRLKKDASYFSDYGNLNENTPSVSRR